MIKEDRYRLHYVTRELNAISALHRSRELDCKEGSSRTDSTIVRNVNRVYYRVASGLITRIMNSLFAEHENQDGLLTL